MEFYNWPELVVGFGLVFILMMTVKFHQLFKYWRNSFYTELYSSFVEFIYRRKSLSRMSTSYWLKNQLGDHRIFFQLAKSADAARPQAYIIIILSSGVYVLQIKNDIGKIVGDIHNNFSVLNGANKRKKIESPIQLLNDFISRWIAATQLNCPIYKMIVLSDDSTLKIVGKFDNSITITHRNELFISLKEKHYSQQPVLEQKDIEQIYLSFLAN